MKRIGLLSDTHGYIDERMLEFFAPCDEIWHAGDIGATAVTDRLAAFRPLRAVYGNIDGQDIRRMFPEFLSFMCEDVNVLMTHIGGYPRRYDRKAYARIMADRPRLFICGHSHILKVMYDKSLDMLCINPGAAGLYGFHNVRTLVRFDIEGADIRNLEVLELQRKLEKTD